MFRSVVVAGVLLGAGVARADDDRLEIVKDGATVSMDCSGREVMISASRGAVTLTGECLEVDIKGSENTIRIDRATKLEIWGSKNVIDVAATGKVQAAGDDNRVHYVKGLGKKKAPAKKLWGTGNVIKRVTKLSS